MIDIFRKIFRRRSGEKVESNLRLSLSVSNFIVSAGLFSMILNEKLETSQYFGKYERVEFLNWVITRDFWHQIVLFLIDKWLLLAVSFFIFIWFLLYRRAARNETDILVALYSRINPPPDWERTIGRKWVPVLSIGITCAFLVMAWFVDKIEILCIVMLFLNVMDTTGNNLVRRNLVQHFRNPDFVPPDSDDEKQFIMQRRKIAEDYWVWKPQIERIGLMMIGVFIAFLLATSDRVFGLRVWEELPYAVLILIIVANEITMGRWRIERDTRLEEVDLRQTEAERRRGDEIVAL